MSTGILYAKLMEMNRQPIVLMPWFPVWGECIILIIFGGIVLGGFHVG